MKQLSKVAILSALSVSGFVAPSAQALTIQATCDGPGYCDIELTGSSFVTNTGIEIDTDNIIGWSMINDTSKANGYIVKPRNEDYRFLIKYFDVSGKRQLAQIGFFNWKSAQVFISSLQLMSGLAPNHDQSGAPTKCTYNGKNADSGSILNDEELSKTFLDRAESLYFGGVVGAAIGTWLENPTETFGKISAAGVGGLAGLAIVEGLSHKSGTFMLEKNIMSAVRSTPADSSEFFDGSFKHLESCKDEPKYTPFPISIK